MSRSPRVSALVEKSLACGVRGSSKNVSTGSRSGHARGDPGFFPPELVVQVKAIACELPATFGVPLSRWSTGEIGEHVRRSGLVASISDSTIWRWLSEDAIRPWQHRCWVFPRDPDFAIKAGRILDLYHRRWKGRPLQDDEFVICADEKTSIQARHRRHPTLPARPGLPMKVEHEYKRCGAWTYLAALDVHRVRIHGRCEPKNGIAPFDRLVDQVMKRCPYRDARTVFWVLDNGSAHRGEYSIQRLQERYPHLIPVHGPVHASWLNQIEIYFSIIQRKVLTPNDFPSLEALAQRLKDFAKHYERIADPFQWTFTRRDLNALLKKLDESSRLSKIAA